MKLQKLGLIIIALLSSLLILAQEFVVTTPQLKAVVIEQYTGINCPYCPLGTTISQGILNSNPGKASVISIHQGGFATPTGSQPDFRTSFGNALAAQTNLEGYPAATINRHYFPDLSTGGGTGLNRGVWAAAANQILTHSSYLNMGVSTSFNEETRELSVTVEAYYVEDLPFGINSNYFQVALVESNIIGPQSGASASYNHKNVLRHLITGQWGDIIEDISAGTVVSRTYQYIVPEEWIVENCEIVAFVTETRQEIITGATVPLIDGFHNGAIAPDYARLFTSENIAIGVESENTDFECTIINGLNELQNLSLNLSFIAPDDWNVSFIYDSQTYTDSHTFSLDANQTGNLVLRVVPGESPGVAQCILTLNSADYPSLSEKLIEVFVVADVENLIVNGSGNNTVISSYEFESYYREALINAGCLTIGAIPGYTLEQAASMGALDNVKNIYMNIGGTTPVLTLGQVNILKDFMNSGGNIFIAGQDFARDIMASGSTSGSITHKLFFQNDIDALYVNDGSSANNSIVSSQTDSIFGYVQTSALIDRYGGEFDPDIVKKNANSNEIFFYPDGRAGALRTYKGSARIVYLAFGLEQVADEEVRNEIMDRTYRWFQGWEGSNVEMLNTNSFNIYPNPTNNVFTVEGFNQNLDVIIYDLSGKILVSETNIGSGNINVSQLKEGMYIVKILVSDKTYTHKLNIYRD